MTYNIFSSTAPAMPMPTKGTEICKLLLSKVSKDMQEPLVPMAIPALAAHLCDVKFMYSDNKYYELCGQMGHLIGPSGIGKAQFGSLKARGDYLHEIRRHLNEFRAYLNEIRRNLN